MPSISAFVKAKEKQFMKDKTIDLFNCVFVGLETAKNNVSPNVA